MSAVAKPIKWHGGKDYLAKWIIGHMPKHTHYVEPYFGGGSVLLQKDPQGVSEVVNDRNGALMAFWSVLQSDQGVAALQRAVEAIPFSEERFQQSLRTLPTLPDTAEFAKAVHFFVVARQSRQGLCKDFATLSRSRTRRGMNEQVSSWLTAIDGLPDVHARIQRVVLYNKPAVDVIRQQDSPDTLFYLDPPYLHETRVTTGDYAHEMSEHDHMELLETISGIKGKFLLSGYPSSIYDNHAKQQGWGSTYRHIDNKASSQKTKEKKCECLWANFDLTVKCQQLGAA